MVEVHFNSSPISPTTNTMPKPKAIDPTKKYSFDGMKLIETTDATIQLTDSQVTALVAQGYSDVQYKTPVALENSNVSDKKVRSYNAFFVDMESYALVPSDSTISSIVIVKSGSNTNNYDLQTPNLLKWTKTDETAWNFFFDKTQGKVVLQGTVPSNLFPLYINLHYFAG